jgi:hypothetical protein
VTHETVIQGRRKFFQVQPDVEGAVRWNVHFQSHLFESLEDVISFGLEVFLEGELEKTDGRRVRRRRERDGYPLLGGILRVQHRDGSKLEPSTNLASIIYTPRRGMVCASVRMVSTSVEVRT